MLTRRRRAGRGAPMATTRPTVAAPSSAGRTTLIRVAPFGPEAGPATRGPAAARAPRVTVQGGFSLRTPDNGTVPLVGEARRLLVLLALRGNMVHRALVAGQLWSEVTERRAHSSLRSALARLPVQARTVVVISPAEVGLTDGVTIDLRESRALADRLLLTPGGCPDADDCSARAVGMLSTDLLPGWDEDWASCEAEQWHQVRMHALEAMADHLVGPSPAGANSGPRSAGKMSDNGPFLRSRRIRHVGHSRRPVSQERSRRPYPRASGRGQPVGGAAAIRHVPRAHRRRAWAGANAPASRPGVFVPVIANPTDRQTSWRRASLANGPSTRTSSSYGPD